MTEYSLSDNAKEDLYRIYFYGRENFGIQKSEEYLIKMHGAFEEIANNPLQYQQVIGQYRRYVFHSDSIYYRIIGDNIEIIRILGCQDIDNNLI